MAWHGKVCQADSVSNHDVSELIRIYMVIEECIRTCQNIASVVRIYQHVETKSAKLYHDKVE